MCNYISNTSNCLDNFTMVRGITSQHMKTKRIIQCVLDCQEKKIPPTYIQDILSRRGAKIEDFKSLNDLVLKKRLRRVDMYTLFYPYDKTEHGRILYLHLVGLKPQKNIKASLRACFTTLVASKKSMESYPMIVYDDFEFFST